MRVHFRDKVNFNCSIEELSLWKVARKSHAVLFTLKFFAYRCPFVSRSEPANSPRISYDLICRVARQADRPQSKIDQIQFLLSQLFPSIAKTRLTSITNASDRTTYARKKRGNLFAVHSSIRLHAQFV